MTADLKRCSRCRKEQPIAQFHKNRAARDGFAPECKTCRKRIDYDRASALQDYRDRYTRKARPV